MLVLLMALILCTSFLGSITNHITSMRAMNHRAFVQQENLRRYINDNHVSVTRLQSPVLFFLRSSST